MQAAVATHRAMANKRFLTNILQIITNALLPTDLVFAPTLAYWGISLSASRRYDLLLERAVLNGSPRLTWILLTAPAME